VLTSELLQTPHGDHWHGSVSCTSYTAINQAQTEPLALPVGTAGPSVDGADAGTAPPGAPTPKTELIVGNAGTAPPKPGNVNGATVGPLARGAVDGAATEEAAAPVRDDDASPDDAAPGAPTPKTGEAGIDRFVCIDGGFIIASST
jgi:hypothetical protein